MIKISLFIVRHTYAGSQQGFSLVSDLEYITQALALCHTEAGMYLAWGGVLQVPSPGYGNFKIGPCQDLVQHETLFIDHSLN